ncbi:tryptophan halogenase family protein [Shewanella sp. 10N.286.51.B2]|uniref:tryptophan halogenase family protein n=1 Tax=Shewanella sp. 10N.286.51.B2 TaxID=3229707 RepID=UPI00354E0177
MNNKITEVVIVGGGTAGWLTAGILAAQFKKKSLAINITLVESADIPTIGVGEGTWPSMRETLKHIGIRESDFLTHCDASFKQASKFVHWNNPTTSHSFYYHPFTQPVAADFQQRTDIAVTNHSACHYDGAASFAQLFCYQSSLCQLNLAPKLTHTADYDYIGNYGYHLDAGKFALLLKNHCIDTLNIKHISANVIGLNADATDFITCLQTDSLTSPLVNGDLFIDCSGQQGLLIKQHYKIPFICKKSILFNDRAVAAQVPYSSKNHPINSSTLATAQAAGWIWDIGLQSRRGVGYVYSSEFISDEEAKIALTQYIGGEVDSVSVKHLSFNPGHLSKFWHNNCVAIGMSAGFIEPLEASALALVEQSAMFIAEQFPHHVQVLPLIEERFNQRMLNHWQQIIDFLKLHYVLSNRKDSEYWRKHKDDTTTPTSLLKLLALWQHQAPSKYDITQAYPLFPAASYQYVYYGMKQHELSDKLDLSQYSAQIQKVAQQQQQLKQVAICNRSLLNSIQQSIIQTSRNKDLTIKKSPIHNRADDHHDKAQLA